jgi:TetR/AcrR family transcriptional repressor of nem operon
MLIARYAEFADTPDRVCLCGALAGEIPALLLKLRDRVDRFFTTHQWWLAEIPKRAVARGEFKLSQDRPARQPGSSLRPYKARLSSGARRSSQMTDIISALKSQLASA